jgi:hypothetical protein
MNKEIAREIATRWLARLRAPNSKQKRRFIQDHKSACAIGHAGQACADLLGLPIKDGILWWPDKPETPVSTRDVLDRLVEHGFKEASLYTVIKLNDQSRLSLPEIADWVEDQLQRDGVLS